MSFERNWPGTESRSALTVEKYLKDVEFPKNRNQLVAHARHEGADQGVIDTLERIPSGDYGSMEDLMIAVEKNNARS